VPEQAAEQHLEVSCAHSSKQGSQSSGSEQAVGWFVTISEGGGRQCSCAAFQCAESSRHKGLAAHKAGGRDPGLSFESKGEAASLLPGLTPLLAKRILSVIEEHQDSVWKTCGSPHQLPIATRHQAPDACCSFMIGDLTTALA